MAIGPNERRAKAAETDRAAREQLESETNARNAKTAGLKKARLARDAAEAAAEKPATLRGRGKKRGT